MVNRKGMGKGKGKGYKNLQGRDPKIHSDSGMGRKQPQKIPNIYITAGDRDITVPKRHGLEQKFAKSEKITEVKFDPTVENAKKKEGFFSKAKTITVRGAKAGGRIAQSKIEKLKEKRKQKKIEELEEINHPLVSKLERQKERVDTLKTQISENDDDNKEDELFTELGKEQEQLREAQEKITNLKVQDLSDRELKTLSIRWKDDSIFGSDNPYTKELKRRIRAEKTIEKELEEERNKKDEGSIFDF